MHKAAAASSMNTHDRAAFRNRVMTEAAEELHMHVLFNHDTDGPSGPDGIISNRLYRAYARSPKHMRPPPTKLLIVTARKMP